MVDMLSKWSEVFPSNKGDTGPVARALLEEILPRWELQTEAGCWSEPQQEAEAIPHTADNPAAVKVEGRATWGPIRHCKKIWVYEVLCPFNLQLRWNKSVRGERAP